MRNCVRLKYDLSGTLCLLTVILLLSSHPAGASPVDPDDYFDLPPEQLLSAKVYSASKKSEPLSTTPAAVYVLTQEDIQRSGATNIPDLLRMVPGVNVAQVDSNSWAVSIRGFQDTLANKLLVMIDGRTVYNPLFSGTFWEVQDLPLEDISRIEVVRGSGGALWGANAVNGVINILTKNAKETQGTLVSGGVGTYENRFVTARHGGTMGDDAWYRVYAKHFDRDSFRTFGDDDKSDEWDSYRTGFRMDWGDINSKQRGILHGDIYRNDSDELDTTFSLTAPFSRTSADTVKSRGGNILGLWRNNYDDGSALKLQSYVDYSERRQILLQDERWIFDTEAQYNFRPLGNHEIIAGGSYRLSHDDLGGSSLVAFNPASRTDHLFSAFVQDKYTLVPDLWFLTAGSKFEHNEYTGFEMQPNARVTWTPDERQTVWGAISRSVRTPSRIERDLSLTNLVVGPGVVFPGFPTELILQRNDNFGTEKMLAYELGYRNQVTPAISLDTAAFINHYDDLSSSFVLPSTFVPAGAEPAHFELPVMAVNGMKGDVFGIELASSWNVNADWKLTAGYTFLKMDLHAPPVLSGRDDTEEGRSPQHQFNIRSYWNINERWSLDTLAYYVDQLPQDNVDDYVRLDLNLGWKIDENVHFNLVGQNLLDDAHHEFGGQTGANTAQVPRGAYGKLTWQF